MKGLTRPRNGDRVVVVGASASGLFTALSLARSGREVTVYERRPTIDPAPRTLIVTSAIRECLGSIVDPSIRNQIDRYELFANGKVGEVRLGRPDLIVERTDLIRELARAAAQENVEFRPGHRLTSMSPRDGAVSMQFQVGNDRSITDEASVVVGADGATSHVAKTAGWDPQPTVPLLQAIVERPPDLLPMTSRVWFVPDHTPYFYWLIPENEGRAALGVIGESTQRMRERFDDFVARKDLRVIEYQGARIPRYARWTRVHRRFGGDVYLVGDAAGHVKVSTVGGLVTGFRGALGVAEAITSGSQKTLRSLKRELDAHLLVRRVLHSFGETEYCRLLDLLNGPTRDSLYARTRDDAAAILWRVALKQPRFVPMSLRALMAGTSK